MTVERLERMIIRRYAYFQVVPFRLMSGASQLDLVIYGASKVESLLRVVLGRTPLAGDVYDLVCAVAWDIGCTDLRYLVVYDIVYQRYLCVVAWLVKYSSSQELEVAMLDNVELLLLHYRLHLGVPSASSGLVVV